MGGFKRKLTCFIRTIPSLKRLEDVVFFNIIPAITGGNLCSDNDCTLLSLSERFGELAIQLLQNDAKYEYENSRKLKSSRTKLIKGPYQIYSVNETEQKSKKKHENW